MNAQSFFPSRKSVLTLASIIIIIQSKSIAQSTYIPYDSFEQNLINFGFDGQLDDYELTADISTLKALDLSAAWAPGLTDLTGIEDFVVLQNSYIEGQPGGCTNPTACNYDPNADSDDGSCINAQPTTTEQICMYEALNDCTIDGASVCDNGFNILWGPTFSQLLNYPFVHAIQVTVLQTSCASSTFNILINGNTAYSEYLSLCDCEGPRVISYTFADNYWDEGPVTIDFSWTGAGQVYLGALLLDVTYSEAATFGCTDESACNYNPNATCLAADSCIYGDGCTNVLACNYNPAAFCDDGSCQLPDGCTDSNACNYSEVSLCDDGSCVYPPANDLCIHAEILSAGVTVNGDNTHACNNTDNMSCGSGDITYDVWYMIIPITGGDITVSTILSGSMTDSRLAVWDDCGGTELYCNDDFNLFESSITFTPECGQTYLVQANSWSNLDAGTFEIIYTEQPEPQSFCNDPAACNYNPCAVNGNNCYYPGCTNPVACNYNPIAGCEDNSCILPDGCTNPMACNFDPAALCDDGSCILPDGCTDSNACNYNQAAICDDGSCNLPDGCINPVACNYNPAALCDNGSCILPDGCTNATACNFNPAAICDDGSCILPDGCTDSNACNYNPAALCDDGSCLSLDCAGACGGTSISDDCGNCYDPFNPEQVVTEFDFTGDVQTYTVPAGVYNLNLEVWGAQGGNSYNSFCDCYISLGGAGGYSYGELSVVPGQQLFVYVGGKGADGGAGGWNGGGNGSYCGFDAAGGGATDVRTVSNNLNTRVIVAGGGGGGYFSDFFGDFYGGAGGGINGGDGVGLFGENGIGGTQNAAGLGGGFGFGGSQTDFCGNGAGGGGWYGGGYGGNSLAGGGGGSGYIGGVINGVTQTSGHTGNGYAIISYDIIPDCSPGCTDPAACNYDASASYDDGSCILPDGCTIQNACNFNPNATCDNGSCVFSGCTNPLACNYDANAGCDDGTCLLPDGCTNPVACNFNPGAFCDDGSCELPGCSDPSACNYDANASCPDGLCIFGPENDLCANALPLTEGISLIGDNTDACITMDDFQCLGGEMTKDVWYSITPTGASTITVDVLLTGTMTDSRLSIWDACGGNVLGCNDDAGGQTLASKVIFNGNCGNTYLVQVTSYTNNNNGSFEVVYTESPDLTADCNDPNACNYTPCAPTDSGCTYAGCTDVMACNYDPNAGCDDGSCQSSGCMDPNACNYNDAASCDDGSCIVALANDLCSNAIPLTVGVPMMGDNTNACVTLNDFQCLGGQMTNDVWYSISPSGAGIITVNVLLTGTMTDSRLSIWDACGGNVLGCNDDSGQTLASEVIFDANCGNTYLVQVTSYNNNTNGSFEVVFTESLYPTTDCNDPNACNYSECSNNDSGCLYAGCTNITACNYNPDAGCDDGSCINEQPINTAEFCLYDFNGNCEADGNNICEIGFQSISSSLNYAVAMDYPVIQSIQIIVLHAACAPVDFSIDLNGAVIHQELINGCSCETFQTIEFSYADLSAQVPGNNQLNLNWTGDFFMSLVLVQVNYADFKVEGCTDVLACNYDPNATCDDNSCDYNSCDDCYGDINNDGVINTGDLLDLLSEFGCAANCAADVNGDGVVNTGDLLDLLAIFGTACP